MTEEKVYVSMIAKNIVANYAAGSGPVVRAVDDVSFSIVEGEVFGVVGESGCGKSTLASVLSLTAPPTLKIKSGEMTLDGQTLSFTAQKKVSNDWHGSMVALLPQRAMNSLNPTARVRDIVIDVMRGHHPDMRPAEAVQRAQERFQQLGLPVRVIESYPHQLSGGMRQRVVAVISTLLNPKVLIADEPTSALDVSSQKQFTQLLQQLLEHKFISCVVFITHDLPMLSNIADRIAVMYAGKLVEIGSTEEIIEHPQHPYTKALIASTLDLDPELRKHPIKGITGSPPDLRYPPAGCRFHPRCSHVMNICSLEVPPIIGNEGRFAACWWVKEQVEQSSVQEAT